jgi:hypothetical protein
MTWSLEWEINLVVSPLNKWDEPRNIMEYYGIFTYRFLTTNYMIQHDFTVEPFNHETLGFHGILIAIYMYICYPTIFNFVLSQNRVVTPKCHGSSALCLFNWSFGTAWDTVHQ